MTPEAAPPKPYTINLEELGNPDEQEELEKKAADEPDYDLNLDEPENIDLTDDPDDEPEFGTPEAEAPNNNPLPENLPGERAARMERIRRKEENTLDYLLRRYILKNINN